jgi:hypothetical protein
VSFLQQKSMQKMRDPRFCPRPPLRCRSRKRRLRALQGLDEIATGRSFGRRRKLRQRRDRHRRLKASFVGWRDQIIEDRQPDGQPAQQSHSSETTLDPAHVQRIVRLEVRFGRFARVRLADVPDDVTGEEAFGYVLTPKAHDEDVGLEQTPAPWVSSIRAGTASRVETWYRTEPLDYASPFWRGGVA